jgi:hypothetical protein
MTPTAEEMLDTLILMFPEFKMQWEIEGYGWKSNKDGSFELCGLFSEFSGFVRDKFSQMPDWKKAELMNFIESCVTDDLDDKLDEAVCTCFLENLASEPPLSAELRRYMGQRSLVFFNEWDFPEVV